MIPFSKSDDAFVGEEFDRFVVVDFAVNVEAFDGRKDDKVPDVAGGRGRGLGGVAGPAAEVGEVDGADLEDVTF